MCQHTALRMKSALIIRYTPLNCHLSDDVMKRVRLYDILLGSQTRSMYEVVMYKARLSTIVMTLTHASSQPLSFKTRTVILR